MATEGGITRDYGVRRQSSGPMKNGGQKFHLHIYDVTDEWCRYEVTTYSRSETGELDLSQDRPIMLRIDSGCTTGQLYRDQSCDCMDQLQLAFDALVSHGNGLIVRIPEQDGRGMGLAFKLATLHLWYDYRVNTVAGSELLSETGEIDRRTYAGAIAVLKSIGIVAGHKLLVATNNPRKLRVLEENGYKVERVPCQATKTYETEENLRAKRERFGHDV